MSARSRIRRLRRERAETRARKRWDPWLRRMIAPRPLTPPLIHPSTMEKVLLWGELNGDRVDRTRRGWNRFPGWTCQLCGRAGHVGPCRKRRNRDTFLKPPKLARVLGEVFLKLAKDLPR